MAIDTTLVMVKQDLEILHCEKDAYLNNLISIAKGMITKEGILLDDNLDDNGLVAMYTSYLYRKRAKDGESGKMPRMLRYALNNRLMSQKGKVNVVG